MSKILETARKDLAAAKAFYDEHRDDADRLPADKLAEYRRMLDAAEAGAEQHRLASRAAKTAEEMAAVSDRIAETQADNERRLPESMKGEPSKAERIRLAGLEAAKNRTSWAGLDLDVGRTLLYEDGVRKGLSKEELNLVIGMPSKGGYWTPDYWERVIVTEWRMIEGVTQVTAPMVTGDGNTIYVPTRTEITGGDTSVSGIPLTHSSTLSGFLTSEGAAAKTDLEKTYGRVELNVYKAFEKQAVSVELLEDSFINVAQEVGSAAGQWFGELMEAFATNGTGSSQPEGAWNGITAPQEIAAAASGSPTMTDFHKMTTNNVRLASGNAMRSFIMPRAVWGDAIRAISTNYLPWWGVSMTSEGLMQCFGYPVYYGTFVNPAVTANANPVGFGNWSKYLRRRVVNSIRMTISDIAESDTDEVTYRFRIRFGSVITDRNQASFINCV